MSYQWGSLGPAFEYPTCYRIENRFLTLRGSALLLFALALVWVALAGSEPESAAVVIRDLPETGSPVPYLVAAFVFATVGVVNIAVAAGQQRLMLTPGQPASLAYEVQREATGVAAGAPWLLQAVSSGAPAPMGLSGPWSRLLPSLSGQVVSAPRTLQAYLQLRFAHVLLAAGLLLLLALNMLVSAQPTAHSLAALLVAILSGAVVARSVLDREKDAPGPVFLAVVLGVGLAASLVMGYFSQAVPQVARLTQLQLPLAAAVLLGGFLLIEAMGLLAGRAHLGTHRAERTTVEELALDPLADTGRVMQEIDLEMHRRWTEGIPNRRYVWQPPVADAKIHGGRITATLFEESQPLLVVDTRPTDEAARQTRTRLLWLWALGVLGLSCTLAGGVLWVQLAYAHMRDVAAPWTVAGIGAVLVVAGGHALRVGHMLWSRFEVESALIWIEVKGPHVRQPGESMASTLGRNQGADMVVRARVVRARSVFFAAAEHRMGSRALVGLVDDAVTARLWAQQVQGFAQKLAVLPAYGGVRRPADGPAAGRAGTLGAASAAAPKMARFCSACGTPLLAGARFCQQCGHTVTPG